MKAPALFLDHERKLVMRQAHEALSWEDGEPVPTSHANLTRSLVLACYHDVLGQALCWRGPMSHPINRTLYLQTALPSHAVETAFSDAPEQG